MNNSDRPSVWNSRRSHAYVIAFVGLVLALFHIYTGVWGSLHALPQRSIHLGLGMVLIFLVYPSSKKTLTRLHLIDYILAMAAIAVTAFPIVRYEWITAQRFSLLTPLSISEIVFAILAILLIIEAVRRVVGNSLAYVVAAFLLYVFVGPYLPGALRSVPIKWTQLLDYQYLSTNGIFGIPLGVSANEVALFIVFAAVLIKSGGANLMNNLALAIAGRSPGGSAKVAVLGSALMGTISGSGTANVMTTGTVTIPMMKKAGYSGHYAAAVEAVSSTAGQFMPPVLGAAAFVLSAFSGVPLIQVMKFALIPAILFFWALLVSVHFEALRLKLPGSEAELSVKQAIATYGHMIIPILVLVIVLISGFTPARSAGAAILMTIIMSSLRSSTRMTFKGVIEALIDGARKMVVVIAATAAAGMLVATLDLTGAGHRLGTLFMSLSGGYQLPALVLAMIFGIILGMGMPTSAAYIIQAATVIPVLLLFGFEAYVVHMFCFYYACLSLITPPVAITAYAAAGIAGSNLMLTSLTAFRLGIAGYIVPFAFVYSPSLLLVSTSFSDSFVNILAAFISVFCLAIGCAGYINRLLKLHERIVAIIASLLLIAPSYLVKLGGLLLMLLLVGALYLENKKTKAAAA